MNTGRKDVSSHTSCGCGGHHAGLGVFHVMCTGEFEDILLGKRLGLFVFVLFFNSRISRDDCSFPQSALASGDFIQRGPRVPLSSPLLCQTPLSLPKGHLSGKRNTGSGGTGQNHLVELLG